MSIFLVSALILNATGCGGGSENTVITPGELTPEQEAEMAGLGTQIESIQRSPGKSGN